MGKWAVIYSSVTGNTKQVAEAIAEAAGEADVIRVQDAGGQQVQDELAPLRYNGVAGIVAARIAGNNIGMFG